MENKFTEEDKQKIIDFLNFISKNGRFDLDVPEVIKLYGMLNHMQTKILPKVEANILEVIAVREDKKAPKKAASKAGK